MTDMLYWWQEDAVNLLSETLPFVNSSRLRDDPVGRCDDLCKALNKAWNWFFLCRRRHGQLTEKELADGRSDWQAVSQLFAGGLSEKQASEFARCGSLRQLTEFTPHVLNHDTLLRAEYNPCDLPEDLRKRASEEHRQLLNAYRRYVENPGDRSLQDGVLKKVAKLVFVVRSNIAHSEKTPRGPDPGKTKRDQLVSAAIAAVVDDFFEIMFDHPSHRLAVYGTLAPGEPNASLLEGIADATWHDGELRGEISQWHGLREFRWRLDGEPVPVRVLTAATLNDQFGRLDRFEGRRYRRILIPVEIGGSVSVCNVYESTEPEGL